MSTTHLVIICATVVICPSIIDNMFRNWMSRP